MNDLHSGEREFLSYVKPDTVLGALAYLLIFILVALLLSRTAKAGKVPSGNQIASALRQKTQNYNGRWDRGQGYGVIDVAALLAAFD